MPDFRIGNSGLPDETHQKDRTIQRCRYRQVSIDLLMRKYPSIQVRNCAEWLVPEIFSGQHSWQLSCWGLIVSHPHFHNRQKLTE